ncbi:hypothetical protein H489_0108225 [Curtobacterium flaccumfaciens UCD-AKU]|uniref:helix-turn-helix domain-containing protein n=1 Tax=Curtobacterium flaccumfaciens TaxID=2035 RepID=UPI00035C7FF3|nr:helix-turn-helix transcriptional regulator [Curtobacterium flaccumfaciens]EYT64798.1 hypothetical protein H489_0108225 [Curtobacterium flaccumfaciens UCD-AKU]
MDDEKYSPQEIAFAQEAARRREQRGWTLGEMAHALSREGIDYANSMTVSRTEKLQRPTRMNEALAYARIFNTSVDEMTSTARFDRALAHVNETIDMSLDYLDEVRERVRGAQWNWQIAKRSRDRILDFDESDLTRDQQEKREATLARLTELIEMDVISELREAWEGAPEVPPATGSSD